MRYKTSLNGWWDWRIKGGNWQPKQVPSSYLCVGEAEFATTFALTPLADQKLFLCFDGIAYEARIWVNDQEMGSMLPYVPYRFDITAVVTPDRNRLHVGLKDLTAAYGPAKGWENYGGIIRDVYLEVCDTMQIADYQWLTAFTGVDYESCDCTLNLWLHNAADKAVEREISLALAHEGEVCYHETRPVLLDNGPSKLCFSFPLTKPLLWSPEHPQLYHLEITVRDGPNLIDHRQQMVGFRDFRTQGTRFQLNGKEIFLKGIGRHDLWGDGQGFTLTPAQMEQDLRMIKALGANYVRLVHYPHHKTVIELADRLGLMVSEEPGLWWDDLTDHNLTDSALEVMERVIRRDRNNASVVFWLLLNECVLAGDYLSRGRRLCRSLDPTRPVSAANCMNVWAAKEAFDEAELDFYTVHPYGHHPDRIPYGHGIKEGGNTSFEQEVAYMSGKPVLFSEWGGWFVQGNPALFRNFVQAITKLARNEAPQPNLAGISFWEWADIFEHSRGTPGCHNGILAEGLVDINRRRKPEYFLMAELFMELDVPALPPEPRIEILNAPLVRDLEMEHIPLDLTGLINSQPQTAIWTAAIERVIGSIPKYRKKYTIFGPVMPNEIRAIGTIPVRIAAGRPLMLNEAHPEAVLEVGRQVALVFFWGHVTFPDGYPVQGDYGDPIARYIFEYAGGFREEHELRNGVDFATANMIYGPSRIDPRTAAAPRVIQLRLDPDWEVYQINSKTIPANTGHKLERIIMALVDPKYTPLLYGITLAAPKV